jgi:hypothetical protein
MPFIFVLQTTEKHPVMNEQLKRADRRFVLSDSSVNEYGFRLLTSGYQMDQYSKNPIGYYMHRREEGVVLRWEDLKTEGDQITGVPVINMANSRGQQTWSEVENGFLNAASVGHIVVLEYSMDKAMMLPGQTGPTITRWYNKECSLVDIPGNCNALTALYDAEENPINLSWMTREEKKGLLPGAETKLYTLLQLGNDAGADAITEAVQDLKSKNSLLETEKTLLLQERNSLKQELDTARQHRTILEIDALLDRALEDKKITKELYTRLKDDYSNNPTGLKELLAAMPAYRSIADQLKAAPADNGETNWEWDDYERKDPGGQKLTALKANEPERYKALFDKKFAA